MKIERSFIKDISYNDDGAIANIIIQLGKNFNMRINSEGIETSEQEKFLMDRKCDEVQGYYYRKSLNKDAFTLKWK